MSPEEIQLAEFGRSMTPLFDTAEEAGWTEDAFKAYHRLAIDQTCLPDLAWQRGIKKRRL